MVVSLKELLSKMVLPDVRGVTGVETLVTGKPAE